MIKKGVLIVFVLIFILSINFILANVGDDCSDDGDCGSGEVCNSDSQCEEDSISSSTDSGDISISETDETSKINKAYDCLKEKIDDKECDSLTLEQKIFSFLATSKCKSELMEDSSNNECWPSGDCTIKDTAQASLALSQRGSSSSKVGDWLISQNTTPSDLIWYLQIETTSSSECDISYDGGGGTVFISEERKISGNPGSCLSIAQDGYWLRISSSCYDRDFNVVCHDSDFLVNLLFKKDTSSTIHISERTQQGSAEETVTEKVESLCFSTGSSCDYEGSLWAVMALNDMNYNIDSFIPYLITMAEDNTEFLPESFLWAVTGYDDFKTTLFDNQKPDGYWQEGSDKFYDTALALFPIAGDPIPKNNAKDWLLKVQDDDGCWLDNIKNTAFILASVWGPKNLGGEPEVEYCRDNDGFCMAALDCTNAGGDIFDFSCSAGLKCCSVASIEKSCEDLAGEICERGEQCSITEVDSSDGTCCTGVCEEIPEEEYTCISEGNGDCKTTCSSNEEESNDYTCQFTGDSCCISKEGGSYLWIWILIILIFLVVLAIIFRDRLRPLWMRIKSKFKKGGKPQQSPRRGMPPNRFPMVPSRRIPQTRNSPRRLLPPPRRPTPQPARKNSGEFEDVLKKLKEMGK